VANRAPSFFVRNRKVELALKVKPKLRLNLEPVTQAKRCVARYRALARDDLAHAVRRHVNLTRKLGSADFELFQLSLEDLAGVHCALKHVSVSLSF
jgi:hypothetical protein